MRKRILRSISELPHLHTLAHFREESNEDPKTNKPQGRKYPRWVYLYIILFPIAVGVGPWWMTLVLIALFALSLWAIRNTSLRNWFFD